MLATMNAAGYKYAASDQAYYLPAIFRALDPALFPRDAPLLDAQSRLTVIEEALAFVIRATGVSPQHLMLALYVLTLLALLAAGLLVGRALYRSGWTLVALGAALTLRHAIAKTGANTLEGYFHPRQLAFAIGLFAVAAFLHRRTWLWIAAVLAAAAVHPTTACWYAVWLGVAAWARAADRRGRVALAIAAGIAVAAGLVLAGPLRGRLTTMDAEWLAAIGEKDLFPLGWPFNVWVTNLMSLPVIAAVWTARRRRQLLVPGETALVVGAFALFALFLCWLPFNAANVALAVQLQLSRVFWLLDVFGTIYVVWWLAEGAGAAWGARGARGAAVVLVGLSLARGLYSSWVDFPERKLFAVDIQHDDWRDAMAFAQTTDPQSGWLADPIHAAKYGASLRAAGRRDVLIEHLKDHAIAMYDRGVAVRLADRERALGALAWNTPDGARALARRYGLDYLVVDREIDLPLVHRSGALFIYSLR